MHLILRILAGLLILMGFVWILQGFNILPGSFMTGQIQWAWRGGMMAVLGGAILLFTRKRTK